MGPADFCRMKKAIGSIFCVLAILGGIMHCFAYKYEPTSQASGGFAVSFIFLIIGLALSNLKKKEA
jgi:hypothetical protein